MATKCESSGKKSRQKAVAPELKDGTVMTMLESEQSTAVSTNIDPDVRRRLVASEAYFLAERRGFAAGHELEDWVAAEMAVNARLQPMHVA
jgi:hypothetical protein